MKSIKKNGVSMKNKSGVSIKRGVQKQPMPAQMMSAIKASPKGVVPPGLAKYLANKKKGM